MLAPRPDLVLEGGDRSILVAPDSGSGLQALDDDLEPWQGRAGGEADRHE
jgi:hypothetical protein